MPDFKPLTARFSLQLESLRGLSAFIVLFSHGYQAFIAPFSTSLYPIVRLLGQGAVMTFFVLSGYLIGYSIQKNINKYQKFNLHQYVLQRSKRILPPLIFSIGLMIILYLLAPMFFASGSREILPIQGFMIRTEYAISWQDTLGCLLFLNEFLSQTVSANAPLWSLSYEVWFYVLAGCLLCLRHIIAIILLILILAMWGWLNPQFLVYFAVWLLAFALSFESVEQNIATTTLTCCMNIFFILASGIMLFDIYQFFVIDFQQRYRAAQFTAFNSCLGIMLSCWLILLKRQQINCALLNQPTLASTANFSYTLYLSHFPILLFILGIFPAYQYQQFSTSILLLILSMVICSVFAYIFSQFLEPQRQHLS
ncbi:acyltransferase [Acinetobacter qingfengensis]|uniref:Acyltransferase 3 domain-containing protein n=1 Tax=Acinetobacter qingfengensis TaxID=1262585 RepID=A0A1E7RF24_9GAMM|nr:acyltransferase [Acinetobacter qingfengensis]KAA8735033.1 acyltransferase [Acinetobacter qingfengensis]OEY97755.1 hypothetical protein BJI46_08350 [Acinetobacter qingfengensis]